MNWAWKPFVALLLQHISKYKCLEKDKQDLYELDTISELAELETLLFHD